MPAYKDEITGKWYCKFYYRDWQGMCRQKLKRGFSTEECAQEYENAFRERQYNGPLMTFQELYDIYIEDMSYRLKPATLVTKKQIIEAKILPYLGKRDILEITAADIRIWQNIMMDPRYAYSQTYLRTMCNQLSAVFNYAVRYYGLPTNPCLKAGSIGENKASQMSYWTLDEYLKFREYIKKQYSFYICYEVLYWTGMREGELLALDRDDIDLDKKLISVTKTYHRIERRDVITTPKTQKSSRQIAIPDFLCDELRYYFSQRESQKERRVFPKSKYQLSRKLKRCCEKIGLKQIRVHDIRHSHVSLLVSQGFDAALIAERVGHERVSTTLNTYTHMFPSRQKHLILTLEALEGVSK